MGGGGSKAADAAQKTPEPVKSKQQQQREAAGAHSAPPTYNLERRGSMMPMDTAGKAPKESSNDLARRGSMAPQAGPGKAPNQTSNNLNSTHGAMRRHSHVAKLKATRDKVGRLGQDEFDFEDEDDSGDDAFGGLKHVPSSPKDAEPPSIKFGRKANTINAAAIVGNEAGGDLSNAALSNLQPGVVKGTDRAQVAETTATGRKQKAFFVNDDDLDDEPTKATSALGKIKAKAKTASVANDLQRRQTARELGGTLNGTKSGLNLKEDDTPVVNGTTRVKTLLENMKQYRYTMRAKKDMSDTDVQDLQQQQDQYGRVKLHVAAEVTSIGRKVDILPPQVKAMCVEFIHSIIVETDRREGNPELVTVFLKHLFSIDWVSAIHVHEWLFISARDGSAKFLDSLLQTPMLNEGEHQLDSIELLRLCISHKSQRLPLTFVYLKHWASLNVSELRDEMLPMWQSIFVEAASHKRAIPNEDRTPRMNLLNKLLSLSHMIKIDYCAPDGEDGLSILQRCVTEGDTTLMNAIVGNAVGVKWNHVYADGHTILSTAVQANHKLIVELLLGCRELDAFAFLPVCNGHVLDFARKIKALPAIIAAIEHRMKILAPTSETLDPAKMSFIQKKRTQAAKEATGPILPDFLTKPANDEHYGPDWCIDTTSKPIVATDEVCKLVLGIELHCQELAQAKKNLLQSEAAEARYFELADALPPLKREVARKIMELGNRICVEGKDAKELILQTVHDLLAEQEVEGNCVLIRVLVYRIITVDFAPPLTERHWVLNAVTYANFEIIESLLRVSKVWQEEDVVALVNAALAHHVKRMSLVNLLLRFAEQLRMATHSDHLRQQFQEFFETITNQSKLVVGEDRSQRKEVLYRMAHAKFITLQYEQEFTGSQTIFSRACREGDVEVVEVMLNMRMLKDVNRIHSNKSTALMQAVVGNQVEVVRMLARDPTVDVLVASPHGTALELAVKMRKDPAIIEELKKAGG